MGQIMRRFCLTTRIQAGSTFRKGQEQSRVALGEGDRERPPCLGRNGPERRPVVAEKHYCAVADTIRAHFLTFSTTGRDHRG